MKLARDILDETDGKICKHCLGRKLSKTIEGSNNIERADKVCEELGIDLDDVDCVICDNIFNKLDDELYDKIDAKINQLGVEFDTFLVGSQIPKDIQKRDEELSEKFDLGVETLKKEVNRLIGLGIWERYDKDAEFERQDIVFNIDLTKDPKVRIQINPLYIEGKYNKYKRGIPQTKWPCTKCKGRGCEECNGTGKQYPESVEELISEHFLKLTKGREAKFHGAGREDIDVLMLGSGRPFVLEIKEPKIRNIDLAKKDNIILYVGRLCHNQKKPERMLKVWERIFGNHQDWKMVFVGDGDALDNMKLYAQKKRIERVEFAGKRDNVEDYYAKASFICLTSDFEGWGMTLTEGMSFGCVPFTFNNYGAASEIIDDDVNGCLIPAYDLKLYAQRLSELIVNESKRLMMMRASMEKVRKFSVERVVDRWENLFQELHINC